MGGGMRVEVGLVLQGGGALGAYEWGAITALLDRMDAAQRERGRTVVLTGVTGVSIGAVNAACLVGSADRDDARARLRKLWEYLRLDAPPLLPAQAQRDLSLFGLPGFFTPRSDYWNALRWTFVYDTRPLLNTLAEHVDFARLNASDTAFTVTAVDVNTGRLTRFSNPAGAGHARTPRSGTRIRPAHILASGSLAPQFPWVQLDGAHYWDGGLVDNAPLADAIDSFSADADVERLLVVFNLYPLRGRLPDHAAGGAGPGARAELRQPAAPGHPVGRAGEPAGSTIEGLAGLVPPQAMPDALRAEVERARLYKIVTVVNVDMQNPADGTATVPSRARSTTRRACATSPPARSNCAAAGYRITAEKLAPHL